MGIKRNKTVRVCSKSGFLEFNQEGVTGRRCGPQSIWGGPVTEGAEQDGPKVRCLKREARVTCFVLAWKM